MNFTQAPKGLLKKVAGDYSGKRGDNRADVEKDITPLEGFLEEFKKKFKTGLHTI